MSINGINRSGPLRMMGLSSGMDTDFIIQQTMRMHQLRIDQRTRARTLVDWRLQEHNRIRSDINSFRNTFFTSNNLWSMNSYNTYKATVTGSIPGTTNTGAVSIRTSAQSTLGNFSILSAQQARGTHITSTNRVSPGGAGYAMNTRITELGNGDIEFSDDIFKIAVSDATEPENTFEVRRDGSGNYFVDAYNGVGEVEETQMDFETYDRFSFTTADGDQITLKKLENGNLQRVDTDPDGEERFTTFGVAEFGTADISINNNTITLTRNDTISSMIDKVNKSDAKVTMRYDALSDRFTIESKEIGKSDVNLTFGSDAPDDQSNNFKTALGLGSVAAKGSLASAWISVNNGTAFEVKNDASNTSNVISFGGVMITVNDNFNRDEYGNAITDADSINVNISRDVSDVVDRIKGFVEAYNSLVSRLEGLVRDRKTTQEASYRPLTDDEKMNMSEKQIEDWEAIAKKGILRNDQGLQNLTTRLRGSLFEKVESVGLSPSEIGLGTGSFFGGTGGQIILDEDRLRAALEEDPERVMNVLRGDPNERDGLFFRMDDILRNYTSNSQRDSINNIENSLRRHNEQIERLQLKMFKEEERLYKMFAAMETAMSRMQSQGDWFTAMMGSMQ